MKEDSFAPVIRRVEDSSEDAPIIKIVNSVIEQAVRDKASDIHIEPQEMIRGYVFVLTAFYVMR